MLWNQLVEADTGLRFYGTTADNLLHYNKIYTVNDTVIVSFDEIEKSIIKHQTEKPVDWVVPYGTKTFLYGTPDGETFYWKDGSETSMNTVKVYRGRCYTFNSEGN